MSKRRRQKTWEEIEAAAELKAQTRCAGGYPLKMSDKVYPHCGATADDQCGLVLPPSPPTPEAP